MELWHKFGNLVCWFVLWLCHHCSSWTICNPQVLLGAVWPRSALMSLWLLFICIHPSTGKSNQSMINTITYYKLHALLFLLKSPFLPLSIKLKKTEKKRKRVLMAVDLKWRITCPCLIHALNLYCLTSRSCFCVHAF